MSRLRPFLLSLVLVAGLAPVAAGCGSGDMASEEVPGDPPVLSIPRERGSEDALADTGNASDNTADGDATPTPTPDAETGAAAPAATPTPAPAADGPGNDQAPAEGTAPDKFEEFCQQNEGAC